MRRAVLCLAETALVAVLLCSISFSVTKVSALGMGMVRFRGSVSYPETWSDWACYGSYEFQVTVQEIISDPEGLLTVDSIVSVCHSAPLGLIVGEAVECYGYYYYSDGPLGCVGHCDCGVTTSDYYVVRISTLADVNQDMVVDIFDVVICAGAYGSTPSNPNWNLHCDIAEPYGIINIFDIVTIATSYGEEYTP